MSGTRHFSSLGFAAIIALGSLSELFFTRREDLQRRPGWVPVRPRPGRIRVVGIGILLHTTDGTGGNVVPAAIVIGVSVHRRPGSGSASLALQARGRQRIAPLQA